MATLPGAPVASQESSSNFPVNLIGYPCRERNTFPSSKDKKFLLWRAPKIPCQHRGFPVSERFGKKKYRNSVNFFYSVQYIEVKTVLSALSWS
jgi:hypothetical protein